MVNIDGAGYCEGGSAFSLYNVDDEIAAHVKRSFDGYADITEGPAWYQSDHAIFAMQGRAALAITTERVQEMLAVLFHSQHDTPDKVDINRIINIATALESPDRHLAATDPHESEEPPRLGRPGGSLHILRRYCPPTAYSAAVIWPSVHTCTAAISSANRLSPAGWRRAARRASAAALSSAVRARCASAQGDLACFSSAVARITSSGTIVGEPSGSRKVLTPMIGSSPAMLERLVEQRLLLDLAALVHALHGAEHAAALGEPSNSASTASSTRSVSSSMMNDALERVLVLGQAELLVDDQLDRQRPAHGLLGRRRDRLVVGVGVQRVAVVVDRVERLQRRADVVEARSPARAAIGPTSGCGTSASASARWRRTCRASPWPRCAARRGRSPRTRGPCRCEKKKERFGREVVDVHAPRRGSTRRR